MWMFVAAFFFFTVAKIRKQPKCSWAGGRVATLGHIPTVECYSALRNELASHEKPQEES